MREGGGRFKCATISEWVHLHLMQLGGAIFHFSLLLQLYKNKNNNSKRIYFFSFIPEQLCLPSPMYPCLHLQEKDPIVFLHVAC